VKYQDKIATSKVDRTLKFVGTGAKIGGNYIKHYVKKAFDPSLDKEELHKENAEDIYNSLSQLKGSALKVAQMLSMDKVILPKAYSDKFTMAQYSAPPLSGPLVVKTFTKSLGKTPQQLFDSFEMNAGNAASIGQVHVAYKDGKKLAVKIQYPGVSDSIKSDLRIVKPIALRMFNITEQELAKYMVEVEEKLLEETDYALELKRSLETVEQCNHIEGLKFPNYYPEYSADRIITMDWMEGKHLNEFLAANPSQEIRNKIGQALWDFYAFQNHTLKSIHADPHPGNFLFNSDGTVGVIDFGCIKVIPEEFYYDYFGMIIPEVSQNPEALDAMLRRMEIIYDSDSQRLQTLYKNTFSQLISHLAQPHLQETFDFGNDAYINSIYQMAEELSNNKELREGGDGRGSRHALYVNRTMFGLYSMLNQLKANIHTQMGDWKYKIIDRHLELVS
jgi:predicted unusual protein kinase regulating ubiquinone biosynthesis (AarF/ABC1/UbiB family)